MKNSILTFSDILCETKLNPKDTVIHNTDAYTAINAVSIITGKCWEDTTKSLFEQAHIRGCLPDEKICVTDMIRANGFQSDKKYDSLYKLVSTLNSNNSKDKYLAKTRGGVYFAVVPDNVSSQYIIKGVFLSNFTFNSMPEKVWIYQEGTDNRSRRIIKYKQVDIPKEKLFLFGYNENPNNRSTGDCAIRALSTVYKCSWHEALDLMAEKTNYAEP